MRRTIRTTIAFDGIGLHGGRPVRLRLRPAPAGTGVVFRRVDLGAATGTIPARYDLVADTRLCTGLRNAHGAAVGTVEHLMAALAGAGVSDVIAEVDGPEVPIMDGSAAPFLRAILAAGTEPLASPLRAIRIRRAVTVEDGDRLARLRPARRFAMSFAIDFADAAIGTQRLALALTGDAFATELADCRTFGRFAEVEALRRAGLGLGGSLENAVVVHEGRVLNPGGLRRDDECVRHKMLDAVGDLALAGAPVIGRYEGVRAGHEMTNRLLRALFEAPGAWDWATPTADQVLGATGSGLLERRADEARIAV